MPHAVRPRRDERPRAALGLRRRPRRLRHLRDPDRRRRRLRGARHPTRVGHRAGMACAAHGVLESTAGRRRAGPSSSDLFDPAAVGEPPSCSMVGVLGALTIQVGALMASEAIKLVTGAGAPLLGRVVLIDGLSGRQREGRAAPRGGLTRMPGDAAFRRTVEEHVAALGALLSPLRDRDTETVALDDALGRIVDADVRSPIPLPLFRNSQMDGYAVRAADVTAAPVVLPLAAGDIPAGPGTPPPLAPGTAAQIMTGAPMPDGADAVVPVEQTTAAGGRGRDPRHDRGGALRPRTGQRPASGRPPRRSRRTARRTAARRGRRVGDRPRRGPEAGPGRGAVDRQRADRTGRGAGTR